MKNIIQYSTLKYCHSAFLGESINIGLIFYSFEDGRIDFIFPSSLKRLTSTYPGISPTFIRKYLNEFWGISNQLSNYWKGKLDNIRFDNLQKLINEYFIIDDASSLQFSQVEYIVSSNYNDLLCFFRKEYLGFYEIDIESRFDENHIIETFKNKVIRFSPVVFNKLNKERILKTKHFEEKFSISWKNGYENLITPISFDLKEKEHIKKKVFQWKGLLDSFEEVSKSENVKFDIFVAKPRLERNYRSYKDALEVLDDVRSAKKIVEEESYDEYINNLIDSFN